MSAANIPSKFSTVIGLGAKKAYFPVKKLTKWSAFWAALILVGGSFLLFGGGLIYSFVEVNRLGPAVQSRVFSEVLIPISCGSIVVQFKEASRDKCRTIPITWNLCMSLRFIEDTLPRTEFLSHFFQTIHTATTEFRRYNCLADNNSVLLPTLEELLFLGYRIVRLCIALCIKRVLSELHT